jgi:hypothetical protein
MGNNQPEINPPLAYELDATNTILKIEGPWDEFACANAPVPGELTSCLEDEVVGRSIFDFITGDPIRLFTDSMLCATRLLQKARTVNYRCDSGHEKRFMQMELVPLPGNSLRLTHRLLRTEALKIPFIFVTAPLDLANPNQRCSICNRLEISGAWVEPDDDLTRTLPQPCPVTHSVCPLCEV